MWTLTKHCIASMSKSRNCMTDTILLCWYVNPVSMWKSWKYLTGGDLVVSVCEHGKHGRVRLYYVDVEILKRLDGMWSCCVGMWTLENTEVWWYCIVVKPWKYLTDVIGMWLLKNSEGRNGIVWIWKSWKNSTGADLIVSVCKPLKTRREEIVLCRCGNLDNNRRELILFWRYVNLGKHGGRRWYCVDVKYWKYLTIVILLCRYVNPEKHGGGDCIVSIYKSWKYSTGGDLIVTVCEPLKEKKKKTDGGDGIVSMWNLENTWWGVILLCRYVNPVSMWKSWKDLTGGDLVVSVCEPGKHGGVRLYCVDVEILKILDGIWSYFVGMWTLENTEGGDGIVSIWNLENTWRVWSYCVGIWTLENTEGGVGIVSMWKSWKYSTGCDRILSVCEPWKTRR
jgi:hypothetical protein